MNVMDLNCNKLDSKGLERVVWKERMESACFHADLHGKIAKNEQSPSASLITMISRRERPVSSPESVAEKVCKYVISPELPRYFTKLIRTPGKRGKKMPH